MSYKWLRIIYLTFFSVLLPWLSSGGMESDIIGGKEAKPHSRPYMASIQINKHHTLCPIHVVLGAHDITKKEQSQQRIPVRKYIRHPMFERNKAVDYSYDIMLLKYKLGLKFCSCTNLLLSE
uniref:Peptidase S1 domain-containing protein n=1 Tax=Cyprinus carpio TaxID=7962 RepID=A0A8C1S2G2_CYPCA